MASQKELVPTIISVKVERVSEKGNEVRISALAQVPTAGWTEPELHPFIYIQPPPDGIYDFNFVALPPSGPVAQVLTRIEVTHVFTASPDLKGVRIHGSMNNMETFIDSPKPKKELVTTIMSVKAERVLEKGNEVRIFASAQVPTSGWTEPELHPFMYIQPPPDGIYDFSFVALPPSDIVRPVLSDIEVTHIFTASPDLKGVRIHGSANSMEALIDYASPKTYSVGQKD